MLTSRKSSAQGTVLVVDDDPASGQAARQALTPYWQVEVVDAREGALAAATRLHPVVILAGSTPPGSDPLGADPLGADPLDVLAQVQRTPRLEHTPVILLVTAETEAAAGAGLLAGAADYLVKPFTAAGLRARVQAAVERTRAVLALRTSEAQLRAVFQTMDQGYAECELVRGGGGRVVDYRFLAVNPAFERLMGIPAAEARGRMARDLAPAGEQGWLRTFQRIVKQGEPERFEHHAETLNRWFVVYAWPSGGDRFTILFEDISGRKLREAHQALLLQVSDTLRAVTDPEQVQEIVSQTAREAFGADRCYYCEIEGGTAIIRRDAARADLPPVVGVYPLEVLPIFTAVLAAGRPFVVHNAHTTDVLDESLRQLCLELQIVALPDVPVIKHGKPVGILCLTHCSERVWTAYDVDLAVALAERTWDAVEWAQTEAALRASEARLEAQVRQRTQQVRDLVTQLTLSEQEERRRISAILHDDLQQRLFSLMFHLAGLRQVLAGGDARAAQQLVEASESAVRQAVQVTRELSVDLSPPVLHDEGLVAALRWLRTQMKQQQGLLVEIDAGPNLPLLGEDLRVLLFQTVRELLFNVVKHAGVNTATVTLGWVDGWLRIDVSDRGQGLEPERLPALTDNQGLRRIEQRMLLLAGRMELASAPGTGTRVSLVVPVAGQRRSE